PAGYADAARRAAAAARDLARRAVRPFIGDEAYRDYARRTGAGGARSLSADEALALAVAAFKRDERGVVGALSSDRIDLQRFSDCSVRSTYNHPEFAPVRAVLGYDRFLRLSEYLNYAPLRERGTDHMEKGRVLEELGYELAWEGVAPREADLVETLRRDGAVFASIRFRLPLTRRDAHHAVVLNGAVKTPEGWRFIVTDSNSLRLQLFSFDMLESYGLSVASLRRSYRPQPDGTVREATDAQIIRRAAEVSLRYGDARVPPATSWRERVIERLSLPRWRPVGDGVARLDAQAGARVRLGKGELGRLVVEVWPAERFAREHPEHAVRLAASKPAFVVFDRANPHLAVPLAPRQEFRLGEDPRLRAPRSWDSRPVAALGVFDGVLKVRDVAGGTVQVSGRALPLGEPGPARVGAAEPGPNAAFLARVEAETPFKGVAQRPPEWDSIAALLPKVALTRVLSSEGSTGPVLEGRLAGGERVAVKAYREPGSQMTWQHRVDDLREEVALYREFEEALPRGWAAKGHGFVDTGGSPAMAMGVIEGKDPQLLTVREAMAIPEAAIDQSAAAMMFLARRGLTGGDSPQEMILTRDQVVNGVERRAGEVVFMDAAALRRIGPDETLGFSDSPQGHTQSLLFYRALARLHGRGREDMTVEQLARSIPNEARLELVDRSRAAASARPLPDLSRFGSALGDEGPVRVGAGEPGYLRRAMSDLLGDRVFSGQVESCERYIAGGQDRAALALLRRMDEGLEVRPEAVFERAVVRQEMDRLAALLKAREAAEGAARADAAREQRLAELRALRIPESLNTVGLTRHFNTTAGRSAGEGVDGAHRPAVFDETLRRLGGVETQPRQAVPGFPGLALARYRTPRVEPGRAGELRQKVHLKTLFDPVAWPDARVEAFASELFSAAWNAKKAEVEAALARGEPSNDFVDLRVERGGVVFLGRVELATGRVQTFGVDRVAP
ncbi:MAG: hypothetical protein SF051_05115, partial [Elusimicrobiota bacterium]|nr:hypothetical protein [Elusimicrobiota bacterium]